MLVCFNVKWPDENQSSKFSLKWIWIKTIELDYNQISENEWNPSRITNADAFKHKIAGKEPKQLKWVQISWFDTM